MQAELEAIATSSIVGTCGTEWVEGGVAPESTEAEPQVPTMEEVAIALMKMQAELEATTEALDFLIIGRI
jgi:hypothetical protein